MGNAQTSLPAGDIESDGNTWPVIPPLELKGSRIEQLEMLDALIGQLEHLKTRLAVGAAATTRSRTRPSRYIEKPAWPWFAAGNAVGALFVTLLLIAHSCA
jgi:hypothetical protein